MDFLEINDVLLPEDLTNEFQSLAVKMSTPVKLYRWNIYAFMSSIEDGIEDVSGDLAAHIQNQTYTHDELDAHVNDGQIHFQVSQIQHSQIAGSGNVSHSSLDTHVGDAAIHVSILTWTNLTFNSTWGNYGSPYGAAQYSKDNAGLVRLRGVVKPNGSTSATIGTLPSGYRPPSSVLIPYQDNNGTKTLTIGTDGTLTMSNILPTWVSLDNITFSV